MIFQTNDTYLCSLCGNPADAWYEVPTRKPNHPLRICEKCASRLSYQLYLAPGLPHADVLGNCLACTCSGYPDKESGRVWCRMHQQWTERDSFCSDFTIAQTGGENE